MKIAVVCDIFGKRNNGSAMAAYNLIEYLQHQGHEVRIVCADQAQKGRNGYYVVPVRRFGKPLDAYVSKVGVTLAKPDKPVVRAALLGVDAVHIMMPLPLGLCAVNEARRLGVPITAGFHVQAENVTAYLGLSRCKAINRWVNRFIYRRLYRYCAAIHYPTRFIQAKFEDAVGKSTPGCVASNGVNAYVQPRVVSKPAEMRDKFVVLTTGRYAAEKGQDVLIRAVGLSRYKARIQLVLGGEGAKEKRYRQLAAALPVAPVFRFFSREEMIDVINYADMYVHPAWVELEGIACIEAVACGKLVVVSDSPLAATKQFAVDGSCVFRAGDAADLARVLDYWIERPALLTEYAQKNLCRAAEYEQTACMRRVENMIWKAACGTTGQMGEDAPSTHSCAAMR